MNDIRLFDPFSIDPLEDTLRGWFRPFRGEPAELAPRIRLDLSEQDDRYLVKADIPGVRKEQIDVRIDGNTVSLTAEVKTTREDKEGGRVLRRERHEGMASRSFTLACPVDEARAEATYKDGVLLLTLPKKAPATTRRLTVQ